MFMHSVYTQLSIKVKNSGCLFVGLAVNPCGFLIRQSVFNGCCLKYVPGVKFQFSGTTLTTKV